MEPVPNLTSTDENGVEWKVKLGEEPQAETAATRLLWAAGYFVDEDYYLADLKVEGLPKLSRGQSWVSADGTVQRARLERKVKNIEKLGTWDWFHNQCGPTKEMNGLRVMMAFVNNWDLKAVNNTLEEVDGQRRCVVTDMGATFGKTGETLYPVQECGEGLRSLEIHLQGHPRVRGPGHAQPAILSDPDELPQLSHSHADGKDHQTHPARRCQMGGTKTGLAFRGPNPGQLPRRRLHAGASRLVYQGCAKQNRGVEQAVSSVSQTSSPGSGEYAGQHQSKAEQRED